MEHYLQPTAFFDYNQPELKAWIASQLEGVPEDPVEQAKVLYLAVRDSVSYNPYVFRPEPETFSASYALKTGESYCRSEEHTSELQSRPHLVCRLLLEKKKK